MATPRTGNYAPLNPLGMHNENRYRNSDYSMGAETQVFEGFLGLGWKGGGKLLGKGSGKTLGKGLGSKLFGKGGGGLFSKGFSGMKTGFKKIGLKKNAGKLAEDVAVEGGQKAILKTAPKIPISTGIAVGAAVGGVIVSVMIGLKMGNAIEAFTENYTGANCGDKAADRGLTEGSDEYEKAVTECQQTAMNKLQFLSFGLLGVVGVVGFLVIKKVLPKGSKE
jgi:hypothetical protein